MMKPHAPELTPPTQSHASSARDETMEALFRHPMAHNLQWREVLALMERIGEVEKKVRGELVFKVANERLLMHEPHNKDLSGPEVLEVRQFLERAGWSHGRPPLTSLPTPDEPILMVVVDHREARIFHIDGAIAGATERTIRPYDPHHFLHHLTHKSESREPGQRIEEDPAFYKKIAAALVGTGKIVVVGHGTGKSSAARHLTEFLSAHAHETYRRIVGEVAADLSSATTPQLLALAEQACRRETPAD
jgi:hypothetical protein